MRNTIIIAALMFFLVWDGWFNDGHYLDEFVRLVLQGLAAIGI